MPTQSKKRQDGQDARAIPGGGRSVRQGGTRQHGHGSGAVLHGRDDDPAQATRGMAQVFHTRWYSGWAPGGLKSVLRLVWPEEKPETTAELVDKLDQATRTPGWASAWSAPARARMDMMSTAGVRTPVGIRIVAASPERLEAVGSQVQKWVAQVPHARSAVFESLGGEPWLRLELDASAVEQHHVDPALALSTADFVISGGQVNELMWHGR